MHRKAFELYKKSRMEYFAILCAWAFKNQRFHNKKRARDTLLEETALMAYEMGDRVT